MGSQYDSWKTFLEKSQIAPTFRPSIDGPKAGDSMKTVRLYVPRDPKNKKPIPNNFNKRSRRSNIVITAKYTFWNFIPFAIAMQFKRSVNMFYLCIAILLIVGNYQPSIFTPPFDASGTITLLIIVVGFGTILEAANDYVRFKGDQRVNGRRATRIEKDGKFKKIRWANIMPGDLILLHKDDEVPCDIVVLGALSNESRKTCYIETAAIDGEINLKIKEPPEYFGNIVERELPLNDEARDIEDDELHKIASLLYDEYQGSYDYEEPNAFMQFNGIFCNGNGVEEPLEYRHMILRSSIIRNTQYVIGLAMYCGAETKLILSSETKLHKFSRIDHQINLIIIVVLCVYLALCVISTIMAVVSPNTSAYWYFSYQDMLSGYQIPGWLAYFFTYLCLFSNIVPIPMVVITDVINFVCRYYIVKDLDMYHEETDTCANVRNAQLSTDLGMITHVFTDKTGTLTCNQMKLVGMYVDETMYGIGSVLLLDPHRRSVDSDIAESYAGSGRLASKSGDSCDIEVGRRTKSLSDKPLQDEITSLLTDNEKPPEERERVLNFLVFLAVCHTTLVHTNSETHEIEYSSESPDEHAFVLAAKAMGVELESTKNQTYVVRLPNGEKVSYKLLAVNQFNSDRKRMSVIVSRQLGDKQDIVIMMKGADCVMMDRMILSETKRKNIDDALTACSWAGLRTLVMGERNLDPSELAAFNAAVRSAGALMGAEKESAMCEAMDIVEKDMEFRGVTAVEDALQDGVPDAIETLRQCGVQLWVLTGDKVETAINIGLSTRVLDAKMIQIGLTNPVTVVEDLKESLQFLLEPTKELLETKIPSTLLEGFDGEIGIKLGIVALIISGGALECLLAAQKGSPELEEDLVKLARLCKVVLACRVSPIQKSLIVKMVQTAKRSDENKFRPITLAIGDGSNDVPMIQAAHVGVGISGLEGRQAVNSADFSISQFRFLVHLMLVHGRWNYRRMAKLIKYVVGSWIIYTLLLFLYGIYCLWSGNQVYAIYSYTVLAPYFVNVAVCAHGLFDRDISKSMVLNNPWIYKVGLKSLDLNWKQQVFAVTKSCVVVAIIWALTVVSMPLTITYDAQGVIIFTSMVMLLWFQQVKVGQTYTGFTFLLFLVFFCIFVALIAVTANTQAAICRSQSCTISPGFVTAYVTVVFFANVLLDNTFDFIMQQYFPSRMQVLREMDVGYFSGERTSSKFQQPGVMFQGAGNIIKDAGPQGYKRIKRLYRENILERMPKSETTTTTSGSRPAMSKAVSTMMLPGAISTMPESDPDLMDQEHPSEMQRLVKSHMSNRLFVVNSGVTSEDKVNLSSYHEGNASGDAAVDVDVVQQEVFDEKKIHEQV